MRRTEEQKAEIREHLKAFSGHNFLLNDRLNKYFNEHNLNPFEVKVGEFVSFCTKKQHIGKVTSVVKSPIADNKRYYYTGFNNVGAWHENEWFYVGDVSMVCQATDEQIKLWHVENDKRNKPKEITVEELKELGYTIKIEKV
tara:strand:+ start:214 stop:639 length:426 start_codon:yes stop_codon:yes gene_type:complete